MSRNRKLTHEDRILWSKVARSVRAMPGKAAEDEAVLMAEITPPPAPEQKALTVPDTRDAPAPVQKPKAPHRHHPLERPVKRKLAKGRLAIDARIDLHGLMQAEAHLLLHDFLVRAHERGLRHVLVITGKGSSMGSEGALKRAVPLWFEKPDFRFLISSVEPAAQNHGGEGALYVRLARHPGDTA